MSATYEGERPRGWLRRILRMLLFLAVVGAVGGTVAGGLFYLAFARGLPEIDRLEDYRPKTVTRIYGQAGQVIGELHREKRLVVPYDQLPPKLVGAFLASEDDRFFVHGGIDYFGILRAAVANLRAGRVVQGGSTVTQQVAKSLIISEEGYGAGTAKKMSRKIREAILARRLEARLSKAEIAALYLNQIFLGNEAYGVQAAAENYFRKDVRDLSTAEIALLAGLPQAPSRYSPISHPRRALRRRAYVLRRMLEEGVITESELAAAIDEPMEVFRAPNYMRQRTPYFTEQVRRALFERFDETTLLEGGLRVFTTVDVERYRAAEDAVYEQLRMVDKRQGYRGALRHLEGREARAQFLDAYAAELERQGRRELVEDELYVGVVAEVDNEAKELRLDIGPHRAVLPLIGMRWARAVDPTVRFDAALLRTIPPTFREGDILLVRKTSKKGFREKRLPPALIEKVPDEPGLHVVALEQEPLLETALLSLHNESGYVLALVGGYSFDRSEFNRATQACRQPGSSFKPVVYSAALQHLGWTPATTILDAPLAFNDASAQNRWKPSNFGGRFQGEVSLRYALQNSMNVPAIRILDAVGLRTALGWARHLGIKTRLRAELGLALGASCVRMAELADVYRTFALGGTRPPRRLITRIEDREGRPLGEDVGWPKDPFAGIDRKLDRALTWTASAAPQLVNRNVSYLITKMMRNVVEGGTGTAAKNVGVPVAGKTGTTNDSFDAWFMGVTTELTTAVWVGFDDYDQPMGRYEQGGRAALPIWVSYMKAATKRKTGDFVPPPGVHMVWIDAKTGKRAAPGARGAVAEAFIEGTEPDEFVARAGEVELDEFGKQDY